MADAIAEESDPEKSVHCPRRLLSSECYPQKVDNPENDYYSSSVLIDINCFDQFIERLREREERGRRRPGPVPPGRR
jgi:hypothetical protein